MAVGLKGLPGLNSLSDEERQRFLLNNEDKLKAYSNHPRTRERVAEILYNNQQFINKFGQEQFDKMNDGTENSYNLRNQYLRDNVINDTFNEAYVPQVDNGKIDINTGAGEEWERIKGLSLDAKERLLNSDWKTPAQMKEEQKSRDSWYEKAIDFVAGEAIQQYKNESNKKILDRIYNDDADSTASQQAPQISQVYGMPEVTGTSDVDTKEKFYKAITPDYANGNLGIPEYASRWGDGTDVSSEMEDFSIDDMRQVLAKKYVYDRTMSPEMAATALNNEAKRYIKQHQGSLKRFGLFSKDVGISAMSYTADKINGIYNLILAAQDNLGEKPIVYVDDKGSVVDPTKTDILTSPDGKTFYQAEDGKPHYVHKEEIDRRTLHNMGKNFDGSDADEGIFHLNPLYWTRAEQFGTLDSDEQKQYEKLGSSPYKVAYNPNDESDLVYESFKMMSFGLADAASMLIPFGVGIGGKALSTAGKVGQIGRGMGKAMEATGKYLSAQSRVGQVTQGLAGAGGIAYAYQRGAFQETLAQNLANVDETLRNKSKRDIYDMYNSNEQFKADVDARTAIRANQLKQEYLAQLQSEGQNVAVNEQALNERMLALAGEEVHNQLAQERFNELKSSDEYATLQQEAIQSAGDAAYTSFWPEAIKYGLVNTVGYRKFLYTNPQGVAKKLSRSLKGLKEVTTQEGKSRLATEATEFSSLGAKAKKFGKITAGQFWGGAWTNGTDDMMVDAAESINQDSFDRYLKAYENGEALADEYGFIDGLYSYWKGLNNSLGQETTLNATAVGGFGSLVSTAPNMANIAHLATKEGREAYKNNFQKRLVYETDENGFKKIKKDKDGNPVTEDIPLSENWRERASFFIQNGVLNNYYGAKQNERDLQNHADYVNNILDSYDDFKALKGLITSDIERENAETLGDEKTMRFVHAFESINALEQLSKDKNDPVTMSSVADNAKSIIENASKIGTDENTLTEEQMTDLISEYYSHNPEVAESDVNHEIALSHIAKNAQKMIEAYQAYNDAEQHIQSYERDNSISIVPIVRAKMKLSKALDGHWRERVKTMRDEIGDTSTSTSEAEGETLIASIGGKRKADLFVKEYDKRERSLLVSVSDAVNETQKKLDIYNNAQKALREATTSEARYEAEKAVQAAQVQYEEAVEERRFIEDILESTRDKKQKLEQALGEWEKGTKNKVLTADEIMSLDPVTRARMMDERSREKYTKKQQKEIEKLEARLKMQDPKGDPLQKIQDIALLTQRIAQNEDAYNRLSRNPDAAALQMEKQTVQEAEKAYNLINERNAQILANTVDDMVNSLKVHKDVKEADINKTAYRMLRRYNPVLLDIIDRLELLPDYKQQIVDAKEWSNVLSDIDAVISQSSESDDWKAIISQNINAIVEPANNKKGIIDRLEQAIDRNHPQADAFEKILSDLTNLGYQRDATVLEKRKDRKEREEQERQKIEAENKKAEEEAKKAAEEAAKYDTSQAERKEGEGETEYEEDVALNFSETESATLDLENEGIAEEEQSNEEKTTGEQNISDETYVNNDMKEVKVETKSDIDKLIDFYSQQSNRDSEALIKDLEGTQYVKEVPASGTDASGNRKTGNVKVLNITAIEEALGDYLVSKYPSLSLKHVKQATNVSLYGGDAELLLVTDSEGNEYGSPSNVINNLSKENPKYLKLIEQQKGESSVNNDMKEGHDDAIGDYVEGHSPSVAEEIAMNQQSAEDMKVSGETSDTDIINDNVEKDINDNPITLSGNAMAEYDSSALREHKLIHKEGVKPDDAMSKYYSWMKNAGIQLQNIIDDELPLILANTPHAKIRFMRVRPTPNATHDEYMSNTMLLVVDYDNSINKGITTIHNEDNGGVIESDGKKYLIVGTLGYGDSGLNSERGKLWKALNNAYEGHKLPSVAWSWFTQKGHEAERFYVHDGFSTEIVPGTMIPGWIIRQDNKVKISDLLKDKNSNPHELTMNTLGWSIIEHTQSIDINTKGQEVMHPQNQDANAGRVFVLIPAGNGKLLAAKIDALYYNDAKFNHESELYQELQQLFTQLAAPKYEDRYKALVQLFQTLYMTPEGHNILLAKDANGITFEINNTKVKTVYTKAPNFDIQDLFDAIAEWNPRINITSRVLSSPKELQKYNEAGALMTDLAKLGTAGVNYSVYAIDAEGNMIKPADDNWASSRNNPDNQFRNMHREEVPYLYGELYSYDIDKGVYTKNGVEVSDPEIIKGLDYARNIVDNNRTPVKTEGVWRYYVLSEGENAEVVKQNNTTKKIEEVQGEEAQSIIAEIEKQRADAAREEAIQKKLSEDKKEDTEFTSNDEATIVEVQPTAPVQTVSTQEGTESFSKVIRSKSRNKILDAIKNKISYDNAWADAPINSPRELTEYLKKKGARLDVIPTDDAGLEAWIHNNIECK